MNALVVYNTTVLTWLMGDPIKQGWQCEYKIEKVWIMLLNHN